MQLAPRQPPCGGATPITSLNFSFELSAGSPETMILAAFSSHDGHAESVRHDKRTRRRRDA